MGKLIIWTDAKASIITKYIGPILKNLEVEHTFRKFEKHRLPRLERGDVCLAMGKQILPVLESSNLIPKNRSIGSTRGKEILVLGGKACVLTTYDPDLIEIDWARKLDIEWDLYLAARWIKQGSLLAKLGDYKYVDDFSKSNCLYKA